MTRSKLGLKALGLCAMLVGLMAFTGVAQAESNAFWLVNGAKFEAKLSPVIEAETDTEGSLLTELGGKFIHLKCPEILFKEMHLIEPLALLLGKATFHKCKFFELVTPGGVLKEVVPCEPKAEGSPGLINSNLVQGLIKLHVNAKAEKVGVVELKPDVAGQPFATIELGAECAFGSKITVEGVFFLEDCLGQFLTDVVTHLVQENKALSKLTVNKGAKTATLEGSTFARLNDVPHEGMAWAGHPASEAEPNAFWLVNGAKFEAKLLPALEAETDKEGSLLTELGGKFIHLKCPEILFKEMHLIEPSGQTLGRAVFHGCKFFELVTPGGVLKEVKGCEPKAEGSAGLIVSNLVKGLIKLHEPKAGEKNGVVELKPDVAGQPFATIELGAECAFGSKITVEGVFFLEDCLGQFLTDVVTHLVQENKALSKLTVNKGAKTATLEGSTFARLNDVPMTWAGHPA